MTDAHLKSLFAEDEPPARDPAFSAAVMEKVARRRLLLDVAQLTGVTALGGLVLWAVRPALQPLMVDAGAGLAPVAAAVTLAVTVMLLLDGRVTVAVR
jgi:hypothetical protein